MRRSPSLTADSAPGIATARSAGAHHAWTRGCPLSMSTPLPVVVACAAMQMAPHSSRAFAESALTSILPNEEGDGSTTPQAPIARVITSSVVPGSNSTSKCTPSSVVASKPGKTTRPAAVAAAIRPRDVLIAQWSVTPMASTPASRSALTSAAL